MSYAVKIKGLSGIWYTLDARFKTLSEGNRYCYDLLARFPRSIVSTMVIGSDAPVNASFNMGKLLFDESVRDEGEQLDI